MVFIFWFFAQVGSLYKEIWLHDWLLPCSMWLWTGNVIKLVKDSVRDEVARGRSLVALELPWQEDPKPWGKEFSWPDLCPPLPFDAVSRPRFVSIAIVLALSSAVHFCSIHYHSKVQYMASEWSSFSCKWVSRSAAQIPMHSCWRTWVHQDMSQVQLWCTAGATISRLTCSSACSAALSAMLLGFWSHQAPLFFSFLSGFPCLSCTL